VHRYETDPGEQLQFDWAEFRYEQEGARKKLYGFTAVLSYSRKRYVTFVKRCDAAKLIRCLMEAFEYMGGLPKAALTDRMKTVLLDMDGKTPIWHPRFADFMASIGVSPRVRKSYTPQTKDLGASNQLERMMRTGSSKLYILQSVRPVGQDIVNTFEVFIKDQRNNGNHCYYCIIDGQDTATILYAYGYLP
jgi:transposase